MTLNCRQCDHLLSQLCCGNTSVFIYQGFFSKKVWMTDLLTDWTKKFQTESIPDASSSSEYIAAHVLGKKTLQDVDKSDFILDKDDETLIHELCKLRLLRMPVQYILKEWDFQDLTLKMQPPVFIPRPETEELVEHCKHIIETSWALCERYPIFLEVGCGSGAISLALLKCFKQLKSVCVEISPAACCLTQINAKTVGVEDRLKILNKDFTKPKVLSELKAMGPFSFFVSNPPYVTSEEMKSLAPEIARFEDPIALDGGADGLDLIRYILLHAPQLLTPEGHLMLEVGTDHPDVIKDYVTETENARLQFVEAIKDLYNRNGMGVHQWFDLDAEEQILPFTSTSKMIEKISRWASKRLYSQTFIRIRDYTEVINV